MVHGETKSSSWMEMQDNAMYRGDRDESSSHYSEHNQSEHNYNDDASFISTSSKKSKCSTKNACCLAVVLILAALATAIGIGAVVYYVLLKVPDATTSYSTRANGSLALLNLPFSAELRNADSTYFKHISDTLCRKIDAYFQLSNYSSIYLGCSVEIFIVNTAALPCACSNVIIPDMVVNSTRVYLNIMLKGDVPDIQNTVKEVIYKGATRNQGAHYDALLIGNLIIDIIDSTSPKSTTNVGVLANVTIWVYNLSYTNELAIRGSGEFNKLAFPFCEDIRHIFLNSILTDSFNSCRITQFSSNPDSVVTEMWFIGDGLVDLVVNVRDIIVSNARRVMVNRRERKIIGTLLITPANNDDTNIIVVPINPSIISPTPTTITRPTDWKTGMPYIDALLYFTGLDYNVVLSDTSRNLFLYYADRFCKDLERIIMSSSWRENFYRCKLINIFPPPSRSVYPLLRLILHTNTAIRVPAELKTIIMENAHKYVFPDNVEAYNVGDMYIIFTDSSFQIYTTQYMTDRSNFSPSPTLYPTVFSTYSVSTAPMTPGATGNPFVSTIIYIYNASAVYIQSGLVDFTYTSNLAVTTSAQFLALERGFCGDIDRFFRNSTLKQLYIDCRILSFSSVPNMVFVLKFTAPNGDFLRTSVPSIIIQNAPKLRNADTIVLHIGDLHLLYDIIGFTASVTNYTFGSTPTISPTSTFIISATTGFNGCMPGMCKNGGTCRNTLNSYTCSCSSGWTGRQCDIDINECQEFGALACTNSGRCINTNGSYTCNCSSSFTGAICNEDVNECLLSPSICQHGGTCENTFGFYICTCLNGYSGDRCETVISGCAAGSCKNGGTCSNTFGSHTCTCRTGWTGRQCDIDINECQEFGALACTNSGRCINTNGSYTCNCSSNFTGAICNEDVNECLSSPSICQHGGACENTFGFYICTCLNGYSGDNCEADQSSSFNISLETVGLTITADFLNKASQQFSSTQTSFCSDITTFMRSVASFKNYTGCSINGFSAGTRFISWMVSFSGVMARDTDTTVRDLLLETKSKDRIRIGNVYGIRIGSIVVKHSDYISTKVIILMRLLNFTYNTDLQDLSSPRAQTYEQTFCSEIEKIMTLNFNTFPNYEKCSITSYVSNPTNFTFTLNFGGIVNSTAITSRLQAIFERDFPKESFQQHQGIKFGGFFIYLSDLQNYTSVPFTFKLLSPAWIADLANHSSAQFQDLSSSFCNKTAEVLRASTGLASFRACTAISFRNILPQVEMDITLNFFDKLELIKTQSKVSEAIARNLPFVRQGIYIGIQIGHVLVLYDSISVYYDIPFDGWIANFTFSVFDSTTYRQTLQDPSSSYFLWKQEKLCDSKGLKTAFAKSAVYGGRLLRCFVHHYEHNNISTAIQLKDKVIISLLFNKTDPVILADLNDTISTNFVTTEISPYTVRHVIIGEDVMSVLNIDVIKVNISNYWNNGTMTTPFSGKVSVLSLSYRIVDIPLTTGLRNSSTVEFQSTSNMFCRPFSELLSYRHSEFPPFVDCHIVDVIANTTDSKMYVKFNLRFNGDIGDASATSDKVTRIIIENVQRKSLSDGTSVLLMEPLKVFLNDLQADIIRPEMIALSLTTTSSPVGRYK